MQIDKKEIIMMPVNELIPYERNPRQHPESQIEELKNSIRQWGWTTPILLDEAGMVIAGHGRLHAAKGLGIKEVPCLRVGSWSEDQKRAYVIADNRLAEKSDWDSYLLLAELKHINESSFDLTLTGMQDHFDLMNYSPNMEPTSNNKLVTSDDFSMAQQNIQNQIEGAKTQKDQQGIEVICPSCAETFTISGY